MQIRSRTRNSNHMVRFYDGLPFFDSMIFSALQPGHRIIECLRFKETPRSSSSNLPATVRATNLHIWCWTRLHRVTPNLVLNTSKDSASTASLGSLFQYLATLIVKNKVPNLKIQNVFRPTGPTVVMALTAQGACSDTAEYMDTSSRLTASVSSPHASTSRCTEGSLPGLSSITLSPKQMNPSLDTDSCT